MALVQKTWDVEKLYMEKAVNISISVSLNLMNMLWKHTSWKIRVGEVIGHSASILKIVAPQCCISYHTSLTPASSRVCPHNRRKTVLLQIYRYVRVICGYGQECQEAATRSYTSKTQFYQKQISIFKSLLTVHRDLSV